MAAMVKTIVSIICIVVMAKISCVLLLTSVDYLQVARLKMTVNRYFTGLFFWVVWVVNWVVGWASNVPIYQCFGLNGYLLCVNYNLVIL